MTYTSVLPSYCPVNAIIEPSGEKHGLVSMPALVVSRVASPPSRPTVHKSPPYTKAIWVLLTVGLCSSSGAGPPKHTGAPANIAPDNSPPIHNVILNIPSLSSCH